MTRRGVTLLEAMIAMVILGTVGVALLGLFTQASRGANDLEVWSAAVAYAESGVEMAIVDASAAARRPPDRLPGGLTRTIAVQPWEAGTSLVTVTVVLPDGREFVLPRLVRARP